MAAGASEWVIEFVCASGARRTRMRRVLAGVAVAALGFSVGGAGGQSSTEGAG
jgi:hypothetical protein